VGGELVDYCGECRLVARWRSVPHDYRDTQIVSAFLQRLTARGGEGGLGMFEEVARLDGGGRTCELTAGFVEQLGGPGVSAPMVCLNCNGFTVSVSPYDGALRC
jgi:hypothetical protein